MDIAQMLKLCILEGLYQYILVTKTIVKPVTPFAVMISAIIAVKAPLCKQNL